MQAFNSVNGTRSHKDNISGHFFENAIPFSSGYRRYELVTPFAAHYATGRDLTRQNEFSGLRTNIRPPVV